MSDNAALTSRVDWMLNALHERAAAAGAETSLTRKIQYPDIRTLRVAFNDPRRSSLLFEYEPSGANSVIAFGSFTLSDYLISHETFSWYLAIVNAVAAGEWSERRYFLLGRNLGSVSNLVVEGRPWTGTSASLCRFLPGTHFVDHWYHPWLPGAPPLVEPAPLKPE